VKKHIEGQIAWGLGDAMWQEITVKDGRVVEGNFDAFQIARMADYPVEVNIAFLKSNNKWISGVGEEAIPQIAPAIAQAVFKITGKRIRSLPLGNHDLRWGQTGALVKEGLGDIMIVVGGGVPPQDYDALKAAGAEAAEGVAEDVGGHRRGLETVRR